MEITICILVGILLTIGAHFLDQHLKAQAIKKAEQEAAADQLGDEQWEADIRRIMRAVVDEALAAHRVDLFEQLVDFRREQAAPTETKVAVASGFVPWRVERAQREYQKAEGAKQ